MIKEESTSKEWIEHIAKSRKADKILVEKVIRALILLERLAVSELDFRFKGGTALMLLLSSGRRLSIDIDIVMEDKALDLSRIIDEISRYKGFLRYEKQERKAGSAIDKEHYKLFFQSVIEKKESYVLLDVLKEKILYENVIEIPVNSLFITQSGETTKVKVPDFNSLLGDKLTAFAPNTTGIPYKKGDKEMGMEIIKQMYDIGSLCDYVDNVRVVSSVFSAFAETEIGYRGSNCNVQDVLNDIIDNALEICLRGNHGKAGYDILLKGINQVKGFIFSESFHLEKAITYAARTVYIASLIKYGQTEIKRFDAG
ncbi:MAG: nucleotidyl transferase AbiEii/AbiGii toxin family protein, partial [Tannerella sp.]|nr:nucleotidyl transferase AbiEii/AbiGii toxin family protein [Tannerella sp.]